MELRKWSSNDLRLLCSIPLQHRCSQTDLSWEERDPVKTLGMYWLPKKDCFRYKVNFDLPEGSSKRIILSCIAKLFDPLGLIAPVIIAGKLILKEVTAAKVTIAAGAQVSLDWDDDVPETLAERWHTFRDGLRRIGEISIERWIQYAPDSVSSMQLHAFCDGSSSSYAASVYLRVEHTDGSCYSTLLMAKSKVTPSKPLTIPRTELSGAVLAIKLVKWITASNRLSSLPVEIFYWTDATIVLHWMNGDVNR